MKIIIITQDDPFYLGKNLDYLFSKLPEYAEITACVVTAVSPFGKKESFIKKAIETSKIFGIKFFFLDRISRLENRNPSISIHSSVYRVKLLTRSRTWFLPDRNV